MGRPAKILFVYPNFEAELRIPLGISVLAGALRDAGHESDLFDPTFMSPDCNADDARMAEMGYVKAYDISSFLGKIEALDYVTEFRKKLEAGRPDLIAFTMIERNYFVADRLLKVCKEVHPDVPVMVGGIMSTLAPDYLVSHAQVDIVCTGEGEIPIVELARRLGAGRPYDDVPNLVIKSKDGSIRRNPQAPLMNLDEVPWQEWKDFDLRHLYKAFDGEIYKAGSFEWTRGCLKQCTFCVAPGLYNAAKGLGKGRAYKRSKSADRLADEVAHYRERYGISLLSFTDADFLLGVKLEEVQAFHRAWKEKVNLPFIIQTGVETVTDENVALLKDAGCVSVTFGIEAGTEESRKRMKKPQPDRVCKRAIDICTKHSLRCMANFMLGMPWDTESDFQRTKEFTKWLNPDVVAVTFFVPFLGTELYEAGIREGWYKGFDPLADVYKESPIVHPNLSRERITEMVYEFTGEFNRWKASPAASVQETGSTAAA